MTRAKICGICTPSDAAAAARLGAAYVGVILVPARSRTRALSDAAAIFRSAGDARRVGVFADASVTAMVEGAGVLGLDVVQLHGDETPEVALEVKRQLLAAGRPARIWKACAVRSPGDIAAAASRFLGSADGLLLEGWSAAGHGGVGARFDWEAAATEREALPASLELIVAGGLNAGNVESVVRRLRPDVVDVSSGVETALCRKSVEQMGAFIAAARAAVVEGRT